MLALVTLVPTYQEKSLTEARDLLASSRNLTIIDIRSETAYRQGHIEGAVLYSRADLSACTTEEVAFYCATGGAARWAATRHEQRTGNSDTTYSLGSMDSLMTANLTVVSGMPESHEVNCAGASAAADDNDSSGTDALLCIVVSLVALLLTCSLAAFCIRARASRPAAPTPKQRALEKAAEIEKTVDVVEVPSAEEAPAPASEA